MYSYTTMQKHTTDNKIYGVYLKSLLNLKITLSITEIGNNLKQNLEKKIAAKIEGKCIVQGFIKPNSTHIVNYSSGNVNSAFVDFQVVFECMVCHPVEGMLIECKSKTITKAGIHAEVVDETGIVPVTVFIARDHNYNDVTFNNVKENETILVRVIGTRFELNDSYICVIGKLAHRRELTTSNKKYLDGGEKPRLNLMEENVTLEMLSSDDEK
uniref:S1 motif domain-containing protein n=1 Tax=viral metagenome TaxID=1070528 RepID=A0A6C0D7E0_9ZZZZ